MTTEKRKTIAKNVREFYLYPHLGKKESTFHLFVLLLSWVIGIAFPEVVNAQVSGKAYLMFVLSLIAEFGCIERTFLGAEIIHGFLQCMLYTMALGAFALMCIPAGVEGLAKVSTCISENLVRGGKVFAAIMGVNLLFVSTGIHRIIYDEEKAAKHDEEERQRVAEAEKEEETAVRLEAYSCGTNGPAKGGDTQ